MNPDLEPIPASLDPEGAAKDGSDDGDLTSFRVEDDGGQRIPAPSTFLTSASSAGFGRRAGANSAISRKRPSRQSSQPPSGCPAIASATASGKTEAAFLPIGSVLATDEAQGLGVLYVSPLKALINDQHRRLEGFFAELNLPVTGGTAT